MKKLLYGLLAGLILAHGAAGAPTSVPMQYEELFSGQPVETGDKIEVREFFWYGCPHCYSLEPVLEAWLKNKPDNVAFVRTPAVLGASWAPHARAYYTFEALGVTDKLHGPLYHALHDEKRALNDMDSLANFAAQHGVNRDTFVNTYKSFAVDSASNRARLLAPRYEIDRVPTLIVDGKYRTTVSMAGGAKALIKVLNSLIERAAAERNRPGS